MNDYEKQAQDFLDKTDSEISIEFLKNDYHFESDDIKRDIYEITLKRKTRSYTFNFGQSMNNSRYYFDKRAKDKYQEGKEYYHCLNKSGRKAYKEKFYDFLGCRFLSGNEKLMIKSGYLFLGKEPTAYDVLACLTKYDPGTFEDFCSEFGYSTDSKSAEKIYNAVKDEWQNVAILFNDNEIELLTEIQ